MSGSSPTAPGARKLEVRQALRTRPWLTLGAPILLVLATVGFVLAVRPVYESAVSVRIDEKKSGIAVLETLSDLSSGGEVFTEMAVMRSRTLAEEVVRSLALQVSLDRPKRTRRSDVLTALAVDSAAPEATYSLQRVADGRFHVSGMLVDAQDQPAPFSRPQRESRDFGEVAVGQAVTVPGVTFKLGPRAAGADAIVFSVAPFQRAVRDLQLQLTVSRPDREAGVVVARYEGTDPALVQAVPDTLAAVFLRARQRAESAEARGTVDFLTDQIDSLRGQLNGAEETLRSFREANHIVSVDAEADAEVKRLADLQAKRDQLLAEHDALGALLTEVRAEAPVPGGPSPFRKLMSFPTLLQNTAGAEMLGQLVTLENERAKLLMTRTEADRDVGLLTGRIDALEDQLHTMAETYWRGLGEQVRTLDAGLAGFQNELASVPAEQMRYARMRRDAEVYASLYTLLQTKQKEAEISAAVQDQSVRVVDPALYPTDPIRPKPWMSLSLAVVVGLVLGIGGSIALEHMDRTVRDRAELQAATGSVVLGIIPSMPHQNGARSRRLVRWLANANGNGNGNGAGPRPRLVTDASAGDPAAEAYRSLRTNIAFARPGKPPRALVFTSPMPGDGKSTTAANFAVVMAQQGGRVLLVDGDMRRGALDRCFGVPHQPGLADLLAGRSAWDDVVRAVQSSGGSSLDFVSSGTRPPNPAELLSSDAMTRFLEQACARYDAVVFDAPPLNLVTDAALIGARADGLLLVARAGVTETEPLAYAIDQLRRVSAPLLGTVLNGVDERRQSYYGSRGGGAYGYFDRT